MIGNLVRANRIFLSKVFTQTERSFCHFCTTHASYIQKDQFYKQSTKFILPSTYLPSLDLKRQYSIGDYDKLWQSVTSGRGKGRSGKKKSIPKNVDGEFLKFGSEGATYLGLNAPVLPRQEPRELKDGKKDKGKRKLTRGWAGTSWPGKSAGPPSSLNGEIVPGFKSIVIEVKRISATKKTGRHREISAIIAVGNENGSIGWAIGKGPSAVRAVKRAKNKAVNYLHYIPICDGHTIYHDLHTKVKSTEIKFERKVPGYGRRCQRIVRAICELAGIQDIRCKVVGRTTPLTVVRCAFQGLKMQETHQELAERIGKHVVEFRPEKGNQPIIVASPSPEAVKRRLENERKCVKEDITVAFDPYRGAHRPKSLEAIKGDFSEVLADAH